MTGDCVIRDVERAREKWSTRDKYRRSLRLFVENVVNKSEEKEEGKTINGLPANLALTTGISKGEQGYFHRAVQHICHDSR